MRKSFFKKTIRRSHYWVDAITRYILPSSFYKKNSLAVIDDLNQHEQELVRERVEYYAKFDKKSCEQYLTKVGDYKFHYRNKPRFSLYFFDLYKIISLFNKDLQFNYLFGDIIEETPTPSFVKSRPISQGASNSVVMKLDALRHFNFINDKIPFNDKKNMLVARNWVTQPHRKLLLELYESHPMCDIGKINTDTPEPHPEWVKNFLSIEEQLNYKFISCIEGNDVATNLKWVMSSNSIAVMPRPKYETWFMEGRLIPNVHYIEIKPDYSDLIEKMEYYISHPDEAQQIISNAHEYIKQFMNKKLELATQIATAEAYFKNTSQL